jgi:kinesin family protein C2/C3
MLIVNVQSKNATTGEKTVGKLTLVDLAGSERVDKSGVTEERLKEAQAINKSLSALGNVIAALQNKEKHIPYRDSKLTYLLQDSIGGNSKTLMFVQVSPSVNNANESAYSLLFASRVNNVELGPAKKHSESKEIAQYKNLVKRLEVW